MPSAQTQAAILLQVKNNLQATLGLNDMTCYIVAQPAYVEGQDVTVLQIWPGPSHTEGGGQGSQEGGAMLRSMGVNITIWRRILLDEHAESEIALTKASDGLLALTGQIEAPLEYTYLHGLLFEPLWWAGDSGPQWADEEAGIIRKDIYYNASYGYVLPTSLTSS